MRYSYLCAAEVSGRVERAHSWACVHLEVHIFVCCCKGDLYSFFWALAVKAEKEAACHEHPLMQGGFLQAILFPAWNPNCKVYSFRGGLLRQPIGTRPYIIFPSYFKILVCGMF